MSVQSKKIPSPTWLDRNVFPYQSHQIRILNQEVHYIDEGEGPTLLLLHGNGSWSYGFRLVIPALSLHFRVIALDYPGFGLSIAQPGYSFKPRDQSNVIEAFVDALNLRDIRLFVEDWGGPIGLGFAGRRPELIHSLIISNTWAWPAENSPSLARFSFLAGSFIGRFLITRLNIISRYIVPYVMIARKMERSEAQGYYMPYPTVQSRMPLAIFPREILASHDYLLEVEAGLKNLAKKPVLIIWGELDPGFSELERRRFLEHFPHASLLLLPNAKHFIQVDEPIRTSDAILAFERNDE